MNGGGDGADCGEREGDPSMTAPGLHVAVRDIYAFPSVRELARHLEERRPPEPTAARQEFPCVRGAEKRASVWRAGTLQALLIVAFATLFSTPLLVVVPLVEEIFWRGFLLRLLIDEDFERVPFGTFSWFSFSIVTLGFALSHSPADWPAALVTGALYNAVAYRTKSLSSCILTHAVTNLLLGLWIMKTGQWGFW